MSEPGFEPCQEQSFRYSERQWRSCSEWGELLIDTVAIYQWAARRRRESRPAAA